MTFLIGPNISHPQITYCLFMYLYGSILLWAAVGCNVLP